MLNVVTDVGPDKGITAELLDHCVNKASKH